jgi:hypothetical protein
MKLRDILDDIDLLAPNAFSAEQKVNWVNQTQRQLYRDYPIWNTVFRFPVKEGKADYLMPSDCLQDRIEGLFIGDYEFIYSAPKERPSYRTYTITDGRIMVHPVPGEEKEARLYYEPSIKDLSAGNLEGVPSFPEDYHELLVLGGAYRSAQRMQDFKLASEIEVRFSRLAQEAQRNIVKPKPKKTSVVRGWI